MRKSLFIKGNMDTSKFLYLIVLSVWATATIAGKLKPHYPILVTLKIV